MELQSQSNNRKRSAHVIKRSNGNRLPQRFIFFDTETETIDDQGTQRLKLVVACSWFVNKNTGIEKVEWFHTKSSKRFYAWFTGKLNLIFPQDVWPLMYGLISVTLTYTIT